MKVYLLFVAALALLFLDLFPELTSYYIWETVVANELSFLS